VQLYECAGAVNTASGYNGGAGGAGGCSLPPLLMLAGSLVHVSEHAFFETHPRPAGRIAIRCQKHSFASDAWTDWLLKTEAQGGTGPLVTSAGTIYFECGTKNQTVSRS